MRVLVVDRSIDLQREFVSNVVSRARDKRSRAATRARDTVYCDTSRDNARSLINLNVKISR